MKKRVLTVFVAVLLLCAMALCLTGCVGMFKCDICQQEQFGLYQTKKVFGQEFTFCNDCAGNLQDIANFLS